MTIDNSLTIYGLTCLQSSQSRAQGLINPLTYALGWVTYGPTAVFEVYIQFVCIIMYSTRIRTFTYPRSVVSRSIRGLYSDLCSAPGYDSSGSHPHPSHGIAYTRASNRKRSPGGKTTTPQDESYRHTHPHKPEEQLRRLQL